MSVPFSVIVLLAAFLLIAFRQTMRIKLRIWQIVLAGAIIVLLTGQISLAGAAASINLTVVTFLIFIFVIGEALTESNYIQYLSYRVFRRARSVDSLILLLLFAAGFASMFLLNDTLAVIGTPVVMLFAIREKINAKMMLLALAFAVTIGSAASPIGNPQNVLVASSGVAKNPFISFFSYLLVPTIINLIIAYAILRIFYKKEFKKKKLIHAKVEIADKNLANLCRISLILLFLAIAADVVMVYIGKGSGLNLAYIAIIASFPILLFSKKRIHLAKSIDWTTIIFFLSLFVLVGSVWNSGFLQSWIGSLNLDLASIPTILLANVIGSQLISNVPMVLIYLKLLASTHLSVSAEMALAAGSTIAGNLLILGAASNVIIVQIAEKKYKESLSFFEFAKVGIFLTAANVFVYWLFLSL